MIDVEGLIKGFGDIRAFDDITFRVDESEIFGFLGPNRWSCDPPINSLNPWPDVCGYFHQRTNGCDSNSHSCFHRYVIGSFMRLQIWTGNRFDASMTRELKG